MAMTAILTKYLGPSGARGSRIKAWEADGEGSSATVAYQHNLNSEQNHRYAAETLKHKMIMEQNRGRMKNRQLIGGVIKGGYAFVFLPD